MKLIAVVLLFSSFLLSAQVLIPGSPKNYDFNKFDWQTFSDPVNVEEYIASTRDDFRLSGSHISWELNFDKEDLVRIEQELDLYKKGIKLGLSEVKIDMAEEAIRKHWENIEEIEEQILVYAGLKKADREFRTQVMYNRRKDVRGFNEGLLELYEGDHEVLFDLVEKTDENLYQKVLKGDDEAYAQLILPQVEKYTEKMNTMAEAYYNSILSLHQEQAPLDKKKVANFLTVSEGSLTIYNCFLKNFENPTGEYQKKLKSVIENWYEEQSYLGASSLIETYKFYGYEANPSAIAYSLNDFRYAPIELREEIAEFYRREFIHNEEFINAVDSRSLGARVNALIGLKYFGVINDEELALFNRAIEQGVIEPLENSYRGRHKPIK